MKERPGWRDSELERGFAAVARNRSQESRSKIGALIRGGELSSGLLERLLCWHVRGSAILEHARWFLSLAACRMT